MPSGCLYGCSNSLARSSYVLPTKKIPKLPKLNRPLNAHPLMKPRPPTDFPKEVNLRYAIGNDANSVTEPLFEDGEGLLTDESNVLDVGLHY